MTFKKFHNPQIPAPDDRSDVRFAATGGHALKVSFDPGANNGGTQFAALLNDDSVYRFGRRDFAFGAKLFPAETRAAR